VSDSDNINLAKALEKYGINLADVVRDTNADTMIRVSSLMDDTFELVIRTVMLKAGQKINEGMFKRDGELSTLEKKINKSKELNLLDDTAFKDAHVVRRIRNKFAHREERLHFDNPKVVAMARQLSTYEKAEFNQDAILEAVSNIVDQLKLNARGEQAQQA
jgi:DNA-binding MltR family transcriptional regulator